MQRNHLQHYEKDFFLHSMIDGTKSYINGNETWSNGKHKVHQITFTVNDPSQDGKLIPVALSIEAFREIAKKIKEIEAIPVSQQQLEEVKFDY